MTLGSYLFSVFIRISLITELLMTHTDFEGIIKCNFENWFGVQTALVTLLRA